MNVRYCVHVELNFASSLIWVVIVMDMCAAERN